jgi:hypothetical protein
MKAWQRVLTFLLLNVVVSLVTTLLVLYLWDRDHPRPAIPPGLAAITPQATLTAQAAVRATEATPPEPVLLSTPIPTLAPDQVVIAIDNVFGVGNLPDEVVLLKSLSATSLTLDGWKLEDGQGNTYSFPPLTLNKGGAVQVHTAAGVDTVIDLYWGRDAAVWKSGKQVTVLDDMGAVRAIYKIP